NTVRRVRRRQPRTSPDRITDHSRCCTDSLGHRADLTDAAVPLIEALTASTIAAVLRAGRGSPPQAEAAASPGTRPSGASRGCRERASLRPGAATGTHARGQA